MYEAQNNGNDPNSENRATRICLETALTESDLIRRLLMILSPSRSQQIMLESRKRNLLERIQTCCEQWWEASSQFYNLHAVFELDGTPEGQQNSSLIKKSQIILCVAIGLIATLTIEVQACNLEKITISQTFILPRLILQDSYLIQMKLTSIILQKMDSKERQTNEFALKLREKIKLFQEEFNTGGLLLSTDNGDESVASDSSEAQRGIETMLTRLIQNQTELLE